MHIYLEQYYEMTGRRKPNVVVEDIEKITHLEWLQVRQGGIGGSDAGPVYYGTGKFKTAFDVAISKSEELKEEPKKTPEDNFRLNYGHKIEELLGEWYAETQGAEVFYDRGMYCAPENPFMRADCDGFAITADGDLIGLEFKSTSPYNKDKWQEGIYGQGGKIGYDDYLVQVMHYMYIMDLDRYDIIVDFKQGMASDIVIVSVYRDNNFIKSLVNKENYFWNHIDEVELPDSLPSMEKAEELAHSLVKLGVEIEGLEEAIDSIDELTFRKKEYEDRAKGIEEKINAKKSILIAALENANTAKMVVGNSVVAYVESKRVSYDTKELKKHPEFDVYKKETVSKSLKITRTRI